MITIFLEPPWQTNQATRTGGYNNRRETKKLSGCSFFSFQANQKKSQISPPPLLCPKSQKPKDQALFSSLPLLLTVYFSSSQKNKAKLTTFLLPFGPLSWSNQNQPQLKTPSSLFFCFVCLIVTKEPWCEDWCCRE